MAWLSGWSYRREIRLSPVETVDPRLIRLDVEWLAGKMNEDLSDVRFTRSDGVTLLDHTWLLNPTYLADMRYVQFYGIYLQYIYYMYYGKVDASSPPICVNGSIDFCDDFNAGTIDAAKWDTYGPSTEETGTGADEGIGFLRIPAKVLGFLNEPYVKSKTVFAPGQVLNMKVRIKNERTGQWPVCSFGILNEVWPGSSGDGCVFQNTGDGWRVMVRTSSAAETHDFTQSIELDAWVYLSIHWKTDGTFVCTVNGEEEFTSTTPLVTDEDLFVLFQNYIYIFNTVGVSMDIDYISVNTASDILEFNASRPIEIPGFTTEQTDITYRIDLDYDDSMQTDFRDVRFYDDDDTLLHQYRESYVDGVSAIYWFKVPTTPVAGKTVTMRYSSGSAALASDGENTFAFFDDFIGDDGDAPDITKWTNNDSASGNTYVRIVDNTAQIDITYGNLSKNMQSIDTFDGNTGMRYKFKSGYGGAGITKIGYDLRSIYLYSAVYGRYFVHGTFPDPDPLPFTPLEWHVLEIRRQQTGDNAYYLDDVLDWTHVNNYSDAPKVYYTMAGGNPTEPSNLDWVFVFKMSTTGEGLPDLEPGDEEVVVDPPGDEVTYTEFLGGIGSIGDMAGDIWFRIEDPEYRKGTQ